MKGKYINTQIWITAVASQRSKEKAGLSARKSKLRVVVRTETPALLSNLPVRSYYQVA